jgi:hypothetical protein
LFTPIATGHTQASFESANTAISLSPPFEARHSSELQVETMSQQIAAVQLELLQTMREEILQAGSFHHQGAEQAIAGVSQQNQELLKAASAIHKRYEAKLSAALKEFRREITELEQQFSMRRVQEALGFSAVPVQPLSLPAAGTLKSKQKGFKSRPF